MKGLVPLLGPALLLPGTAEAEVVAPGVSEGAFAVARDGSPRVAWIEGRRLESVQGLVAGFVTGAAQSELDGRVLGYAATPTGGRQLLLARSEGLEWFELPAAPSVRMAVDFRLRGRVEGAASGKRLALRGASGPASSARGRVPA